MHGIAIAILKYGYLNDNTALRRYTQLVVAQITIRKWASKKKKVVLAARL